jgi:hypothetical protein
VVVKVTSRPLLAVAPGSVYEVVVAVSVLTVSGLKVMVCDLRLMRVTVTVYVIVLVPSGAVTTVRITFLPLPKFPLKGVVPVAPKYWTTLAVLAVFVSVTVKPVATVLATEAV